MISLRNKSLKNVIRIIFVFMIILFSQLTVQADEGSFYVQPILPSNQLSDASDYYHLKTDKDLSQTLEVMLINDSTQEKKVDVSILDGMTTASGEISYSNTHTYDKTQKIKLSEVISGRGEQIIPANGSIKIDLPLNLTVNDFKGQLLGAINVIEKVNPDVSSGGVNNQFAYNIPVKIDIGDNNIESKMDYAGVKVKEENKNYGLEIGLRNISSTIIRDLSVDYEITAKKSKKDILKEKKDHLEMAPNSIFFPRVSLKDKSVKAGEYQITIHVLSKESKIDETWTDTFMINSTQAKKLNNGLVVSSQQSIPWYIWVILIIVVALIAYVIYKKTKIYSPKKIKKKKRKDKK